MKPELNPSIDPLKAALFVGLASAAMLAGAFDALAAGYAVQEIKSPGPAVRMSNNGAVTGFFVAKCTTLSSQPKRTICYNAPWVFDGQRVNKLTSKFPSNANAKAVAVNDSLELVGADLSGAWFYSNGNVSYTDANNPNFRGTRLFALNNLGVAVGMSYVGGTYQPVTYEYGGTPVPALAPGDVAVDINDAGMIAGWYKNADDNTEYGFVADADGEVIVIPKLKDAKNCRPVRISQVNETTRDVWVAGHCSGRPFICEINSGSLTVTELSYTNSTNLSVQAVNSSGLAVGTAVRPGAAAPDGYTAIVWAPGYAAAPTDLNANQAFAPATAWNVHATDINEAGTVLTGYNDTTGNFYTFLLHPLP